MAIKLQIRRGLAADWAAGTANPTLLAGEIGVETDTGNIKIGDGATVWNSLGYVKSTYPQTTGHATNINDAAYLVQGRYEIGTGVTSNVPSGWTPASDAPAILHVTRTSTGYVAQVLVSTKTQRAFSRGYDGSAYTTWVAISQHAACITATELASNAVETAKINDNAVTFAKMQDISGISVVGKGNSGSGDPTVITAVTSGHVLSYNGTTVDFRTLASGAFDASTDIPLTALANQAANTIVGNNTAGAAAPIAMTAAQTKTVLALGSMADETKTNYLSTLSQKGCFALIQVAMDNPVYSTGLAVYTGITNSSTAIVVGLSASTITAVVGDSSANWTVSVVSSRNRLRPVSGTWTIAQITPDISIPEVQFIAIRTA